jgi:hypothetical protein
MENLIHIRETLAVVSVLFKTPPVLYWRCEGSRHGSVTYIHCTKEQRCASKQHQSIWHLNITLRSGITLSTLR